MTDGLVLSDLRVTYRNGAELFCISTQIKPGQILSVMGPSGTGKSTLLAALTGTLSRDFTASGKIFLNGADISSRAPHDRKIGILFQDALLFPHLSVGANLAFGLTPKLGKEARQRRITAALNEIELAGSADRDPASLSGGQASRVALMRTLLAEPEALLLDEPFSRLDTALRHRMRKLVFTLAAARQLPVIMVTHDPEDAKAAGGTVLRLAGATGQK